MEGGGIHTHKHGTTEYYHLLINEPSINIARGDLFMKWIADLLQWDLRPTYPLEGYTNLTAPAVSPHYRISKILSSLIRAQAFTPFARIHFSRL